MSLSERGFRKIKKYEGYGKEIADGGHGGCVAYRETINGKLDIWTCGWGSTEGVTGATRWTYEEAENALRTEIAKHEAIVTRLVTVDLNQNERDALVSFSYNTGALAKSSILRFLNADRRTESANAFALYNKFGGKPCKALISRRADEAALFLEPIEPATEATMPQQVEASAPPAHPAWYATIGASAAAASTVDPTAITAKLSAYKDLTSVITSFGPWAAVGVLGIGAMFWVMKGA